MRVIKQIWRGCGYLPHVGTHPGTPWLLLILLGGIAGGWGGILIMASIVLPLYLYGAYDRAQFSDREERKQRK